MKHDENDRSVFPPFLSVSFPYTIRALFSVCAFLLRYMGFEPHDKAGFSVIGDIVVCKTLGWVGVLIR